jgi:hypothetical protein
VKRFLLIAGLLWQFSSPGLRGGGETTPTPTPTIPPVDLLADMEYDGTGALGYSDEACTIPVTSGAVLCLKDQISGAEFASGNSGQSITTAAAGIAGIPASSWTGANATGLVAATGTMGGLIDVDVTVWIVAKVATPPSASAYGLYSVYDTATGMYALTFLQSGAQGDWRGQSPPSGNVNLTGGTIDANEQTILTWSCSSSAGCALYQNGVSLGTASAPTDFFATYEGPVGTLGSISSEVVNDPMVGEFEGPIIQAGAHAPGDMGDFDSMNAYLHIKYQVP